MKNIGFVIASVLVGLYAPTVTEAQWIQSGLSGNDIYSFALLGTNLFAGTYGHGIPLSTDLGASWSGSDNGLPANTTVNALATMGTSLFAGTYDRGVFRSTDSGSSWIKADNGLGGLDIQSLAVCGSNIFARSEDGGIFVSYDSGSHWSGINLGFAKASGLGISGSYILAGTDSGIFLSPDAGATWSPTHDTAKFFTRVFLGTGSNIFAGGDGVRLSTDSGASWDMSSIGLGNIGVYCFAVSGSKIFAGTHGDGVFISINNGASWSPAGTEGIPSLGVLAVCDSELFAGTNSDGGGVWKRPLSEMSSVAPTVRASSFTLNQNYPNPFNPSTSITFSLPEHSEARLDVFDMLGREVQTLLNGWMDAGGHSVRFDGTDLGSGVYSARLTGNGLRREMRMILSK